MIYQQLENGRTIRRTCAYALACAAISVLLVIPCLWQPRIAAGDLASHVYNVWLARLIKGNEAPGLWIAHQSTNFLFDSLLGGLADKVGVAAAQKIGVALLVLLFFWAVFALVSAITRKPAFFVMPYVAILTYGTVFNKGLFNYYLATALSVAALALFWRANFWSGLLAPPILLLAWFAQPLPPMWAMGVCAYVLLARKLHARLQPLLLLPVIVGLLALRSWLLRFGSVWDWQQLLHGSGLDQSYMLGHHFRLVTIPMVGLTTWLILRVARTWRKQFVPSISVQVGLLCLLGCFLIPHTLAFPWYKAQFGAVPERIGLLTAIFLCAIIAEVNPPGWYRKGLAVLAMLYFVLLYLDDRAMNRIEQNVENVVAGLPSNQRVIAKLYYPLVGGVDVSAILDRACTERCISFGNYEPATAQFRIRAVPGNSFVAWSADESITEQYFTSQPGGTLYELYQCGTRAEDVCTVHLSLSTGTLSSRE